MHKWLVALYVVGAMWAGSLWSFVYMYVPGIGHSSYDHAIADAAAAAQNLHIFSHNERLYKYIDSSAGVARLMNDSETHVMYIVLFSDYQSNDNGMYLGQGRDVAELFRAHCYAASYHREGKVHFVGHSRGAATIVTYLGLLGHDVGRLLKLANEYLSYDNLSRIVYSANSVKQDLIPRIGVMCIFSTFNNVADCIQQIGSQQGLPKWISRRLVKYPRWYSRLGQYICEGLDVACNTDTPPIAMVQYIPAHVPCIFVHASEDPLIPSSNSHDLYRIRKNVQPATHVWCCDGGTSHVAIPYEIDMPEIGKQLSSYCQQMCR